MSFKVLTRVRTWIAVSEFGAGAKLPPERELCEILGISRTELRKALLILESGGVLARRIGRGTFLAKVPERRNSGSAEGKFTDLAARTGSYEAVVARLALEPELARMAAMHASARQLSDLRRLAFAMRSAPNWLTYEDMDSQFHDILAGASGNSLLHALHKIMNGVRIAVVRRQLRTPEIAPLPDYRSFDEHDVIVSALEERDGTRAYKAMRVHLESTLSTMAVNT